MKLADFNFKIRIAATRMWFLEYVHLRFLFEFMQSGKLYKSKHTNSDGWFQGKIFECNKFSGVTIRCVEISQ